MTLLVGLRVFVSAKPSWLLLLSLSPCHYQYSDDSQPVRLPISCTG